ncbi:hypothetical protein [Paraburkholderia sp. PGU19]|uniref:hypothetical protein n=1 Tax=Paraburkholderia sp. PGU19 TaxID=2735434 RepID=UPI0015DAEAEC|nr:hypothetical protein [Paraburkholderia sp. PGU19]
MVEHAAPIAFCDGGKRATLDLDAYEPSLNRRYHACAFAHGAIWAVFSVSSTWIEPADKRLSRVCTELEHLRCFLDRTTHSPPCALFSAELPFFRVNPLAPYF